MKLKLYNHAVDTVVLELDTSQFHQADSVTDGGEAYIEHDGKVYIYYDTTFDEVQYREAIRAVRRTEV